MITLTEPTTSIVSAFNRINYKIVSDNASNIGFKYVVKIYNSANELMTTAYYDSPANPAIEVEFDISKFVQTDFDYSKGFTDSASAFNSGNILKDYYLKCYEYYEVDGAYVIVLASEVVSQTKTAIATSLPLLELRNFYSNLDEYDGSRNDIYKPLTDWTINKLRTTDAHIIGFYNDGKITSLHLDITYTNGSTGTSSISAPSYTSRCVTYFKIIPLTYGSVDNIKLTINWNNGSARSVEVGSLYVQACGKYEPMRLAYLNKYGTYDFLNFDLVSKQTFDIERKGYQRNYTGDIYIDDSNIVKNTNPIYYVKETQKWKIISDYLTDAQSELARQLYSSPLVYMNLVNDTYIENSWIPVKLVPNSYEMKKILSDKLFNLELDLEFGIVNTRQSI
jgi:hypothetical protein